MKALICGFLRAPVIIIPTITIFFLNCQNDFTSIDILKGADSAKYIEKEVTVTSIFVNDPLPMLVSDLKIVTSNVPMPFNQYLLLAGKVVDSIDSHKLGGAKMEVTGKLRTVKKEEEQYVGENVLLEVSDYIILEIPEVPYAPRIQQIKQDSLK